VLALGGLAALIGLFALQVRQISQAGSAPASPPVEPGIALPPTSVQLPSPWLAALPWVGAALLATGGLFIFSRRSLWPAVMGALLSAFLLLSFVPPLSAFPNPAALYWRVVGGYSYDPRLPFKNDFLIAGRPELQLRPYLDQLIGQTGLAPLDPVQPLRRYEILRVGLHPKKGRTALVTTRFIYADGSSRLYPVPLLGPTVDVGGFWLAGWRQDGLERLRSEHLALPDQPFATSNSPLQLGAPRRLDLAPAANRLDEVNPGHWSWSSVRVQRLAWAPDMSAFLMATESQAGSRQLWRVSLDGSEPVTVASGDIREYGWSPDGAKIIYTRLDPDAAAADATHPYAAMVVEAGANLGYVSQEFDRGGQARTLVIALSSDRLPGLTAEGIWFISDQALWLAPYSGDPARAVLANLPAHDSALPPRPAPDGSLIALACEAQNLCIFAPNGDAPSWAADVRPAEITWSPDGSRLAVIDRDPNNLRPVRLSVFSRDGEELLTREVAPFDVTEAPQWIPDNGAVLVQTYPQNGRRIIVVDLASGQTLDLSRERWDAYFALSPDGKSLLLNNGRGDFWLVEVLRPQ
jgi:Tol biopolymer transport system component